MEMAVAMRRGNLLWWRTRGRWGGASAQRSSHPRPLPPAPGAVRKPSDGRSGRSGGQARGASAGRLPSAYSADAGRPGRDVRSSQPQQTIDCAGSQKRKGRQRLPTTGPPLRRPDRGFSTWGDGETGSWAPALGEGKPPGDLLLDLRIRPDRTGPTEVGTRLELHCSQRRARVWRASGWASRVSRCSDRRRGREPVGGGRHSERRPRARAYRTGPIPRRGAGGRLAGFLARLTRRASAAGGGCRSLCPPPGPTPRRARLLPPLSDRGWSLLVGRSAGREILYCPLPAPESTGLVGPRGWFGRWRNAGEERARRHFSPEALVGVAI